MKPVSACTTPRRLMVPISRHFLPVLQPEPPAWLTTGLMKGSRRPFAPTLLSGPTDCSGSLWASALAAGVAGANTAVVGEFVLVTAAGFGCTSSGVPVACTGFSLLVVFFPVLL